MTTIVANLEGMAADSRCVTGGAYFQVQKIHRIGDSLVGTAGDGFMCLAFLDWFRGKRDPKKLHELIGEKEEMYNRNDIDILELNERGLFLWNGWGYPEHILNDSYSVGSGSMAALALLREGKSLEESVKGAIGQDEYTGFPIQVEYLLPRELMVATKKLK
jgi:hypothetical protein